MEKYIKKIVVEHEQELLEVNGEYLIHLDKVTVFGSNLSGEMMRIKPLGKIQV